MGVVWWIVGLWVVMAWGFWSWRVGRVVVTAG